MMLSTKSNCDHEISQAKVAPGKETETINLAVVWRYTTYELLVSLNSTVSEIKERLQSLTQVSHKRQKLIGLGKAGLKHDHDSITTIASLQLNMKKGAYKITMVGTPDNELFEFEKLASRSVETTQRVYNDFSHGFSPATKEWKQLQEFSEKVQFHFITDPRPGKKLLVLDLDHTLLDFSLKEEVSSSAMKRPYFDEFLTEVYPHYDLAIWSQTSWKWLELKATELGMMSNVSYKICFVLDKSNMFKLDSGYVKPLHIIWSRFPQLWTSRNTLHVDDIARNFVLNEKSGIKISSFYRHLRSKNHPSSRSSLPSSPNPTTTQGGSSSTPPSATASLAALNNSAIIPAITMHTVATVDGFNISNHAPTLSLEAHAPPNFSYATLAPPLPLPPSLSSSTASVDGRSSSRRAERSAARGARRSSSVASRSDSASASASASASPSPRRERRHDKKKRRDLPPIPTFINCPASDENGAFCENENEGPAAPLSSALPSSSTDGAEHPEGERGRRQQYSAMDTDAQHQKLVAVTPRGFLLSQSALPGTGVGPLRTEETTVSGSALSGTTVTGATQTLMQSSTHRRHHHGSGSRLSVSHAGTSASAAPVSVQHQPPANVPGSDRGRREESRRGHSSSSHHSPSSLSPSSSLPSGSPQLHSHTQASLASAPLPGVHRHTDRDSGNGSGNGSGSGGTYLPSFDYSSSLGGYTTASAADFSGAAEIAPSPTDDRELMFLSRYLLRIAPVSDISSIDHSSWRKTASEFLGP